VWWVTLPLLSSHKFIAAEQKSHALAIYQEVGMVVETFYGFP